jgi:hypothetical protein
MKILNATSCGLLDVCHNLSNPFVSWGKKEAKASGKKMKKTWIGLMQKLQ